MGLLRPEVLFLAPTASPAVGVGINRSEPFFEDLLCIWFLFAKADGGVSAVLSRDGESADAAEQIKVSSLVVHGIKETPALGKPAMLGKSATPAEGCVG